MRRLDHMAVVSVCPPDSRPNRADNWLVYDYSKWGVWEHINELLHANEGEFDEDDIWVLSWDLWWDMDEVVDEVGSGRYDDDGEEEIVEYTIYETLEWASEWVAQDTGWLGAIEDLDEEEGPSRMALDITQEITRTPITVLGKDVLNVVLQPFIEWRCSLYKGGFRRAG
jgi:hypothetical protein